MTTSSLLAATATTAKEDPSQKSITTVPDNLVWQKVEGLPGVKRAILYGDPNKAGPFTIRLKFPANYQVLAHTHPGLEQDTVISGSLYLGVGKHFDEKKA
ncbi:MAG: cupin domain-containing protein [Coxiellaceae bacterium]|nr:MAG: cupin domain-containing protein [Coxiellaceae bacterium]